MVSELLKTGYKKIDVRNNTGQTALHIASMKGYQEIAEMLLQHEANVEVRDEEGVTPLHVSSISCGCYSALVAMAVVCILSEFWGLERLVELALHLWYS